MQKGSLKPIIIFHICTVALFHTIDETICKNRISTEIPETLYNQLMQNNAQFTALQNSSENTSKTSKSTDDLNELKSKLDTLIYVRRLWIVKDQIDKYEELCVDTFIPNFVAMRNSKLQPIEEVRRQRWNHILHSCTHDLYVSKYLIPQITKAGIPFADFTVQIAKGHTLLTNKLRHLVRCRYNEMYATNLKNTTRYTEYAQVDRCLNILMSDDVSPRSISHHETRSNVVI